MTICYHCHHPTNLELWERLEEGWDEIWTKGGVRWTCPGCRKGKKK